MYYSEFDNVGQHKIEVMVFDFDDSNIVLEMRTGAWWCADFWAIVIRMGVSFLSENEGESFLPASSSTSPSEGCTLSASPLPTTIRIASKHSCGYNKKYKIKTKRTHNTIIRS